MDDLIDAFSGMNAKVTLGIAVGIALLFIGIVFYDSIRRNRRRPRSSRSPQGGSLNPFKNLRFLYRSADQEMSRRRRQKERERSARE
jgi:hypothetical protein